MNNGNSLKHNLIFFWILLLLVMVTSVFGQKNEKEDSVPSPFSLVYAIDLYRKSVADSLKYLIPVLDSILESDQKYRYGTNNNSKGKKEQEEAIQRFLQHKNEVRYIDSMNTLKVSAILDRYGWLDRKRIGIMESDALFFVIQHADSATQEKYLPSLRKAVLDKTISPHHLTMLEDRISLKKNKYQVYGTQLFYYPPNKRYYLMPLIDPEDIIQTRKAIGLDSASFGTYLTQFNLVWDIDTYKKELPDVQKYLLHNKTRPK